MSPGKKKYKKSLVAKKQEEKKISKEEQVEEKEDSRENKEDSREKKEDSKEEKTAGKKSGRKVVPGWGLTRGVHPPRCNPSMMIIFKPITSSQPAW